MMNLVTYNPYRILGVFSNSPKKDMLSNINKSKAFLKVGKEISFTTDFNQYLPSINRTEDIIDKAQSEIERPIDQLNHSLFWFINASQFDDIALKHLEAGDISLAKDIWEKAANMSSLLNLMVCALIENNMNSFSENANSLCMNYCSEFCNSISETLTFSPSELIDLIIEQIKIDGTIDISTLAKAPNTSDEWKRIVGKSLVKPLIDSINNSISETKGVKGAAANYNAGVKLMNSTKKDLSELKGLLGISDMEYQMVADRLAQTILQCGITYFNETTDDDALSKARILQHYALSISVGQLVKDRCKENIEILNKIGPDYLIRKEIEVIGQQINKFKNSYLNDPISDRLNYRNFTSITSIGSSKIVYSEHAILELLNGTRPELNKIRDKLGNNNETYLKISSSIASTAINALVDKINKEQQSVSIYGASAGLFLRPKLETAVQIMSIIGYLDMTSECRSYYNNNNNTLNSINRQLQPKPANSSGGCYIATMVYGDYEHPQVLVLRNFRDTFLDQRDWGKKIIAYYYANSPHWVEKLKNHKLINFIIKNILDTFISVWKKLSHYE